MTSIGTGYDLSATTFSPDGRIFQVEYAAKAVENRIKTKQGVVLAMEKPILTKLAVPEANKRIGFVDINCGIACSGFQADGRQLIQRARAEAQNFKETFDASITAKNLASRLGLFMQAYTLYSSVRPFGASVLLAHKDQNGPSLYMIEPSGLHFGYNACATGKGKQAAKTELEKLAFSEIDLRQAAKEAARIIYAIHDATKDKDFELEITWIGPETNDVHEAVPPHFLRECIDYAKSALQSDMRD